MAINISSWAIRKPLPSIVLSLVLVILGTVAFGKLPITRFPNVDLPIISVSVAQFGSAPAELETQVTKTIEDAVSGVENVRHIKSSITDGLSVTTVIFRLEANTDRALNDIKDAVTRVRGNLPQSISEPLVQRVDIVGLPIVTYAAIVARQDARAALLVRRGRRHARVQGVRGVGRVERIGGVEREIRVALDPDLLQAVGLTALRCQPAAARHPTSICGRPRRDRRARPGDPHARRREDARRARRAR